MQALVMLLFCLPYPWGTYATLVVLARIIILRARALEPEPICAEWVSMFLPERRLVIRCIAARALVPTHRVHSSKTGPKNCCPSWTRSHQKKKKENDTDIHTCINTLSLCTPRKLLFYWNLKEHEFRVRRFPTRGKSHISPQNPNGQNSPFSTSPKLVLGFFVTLSRTAMSSAHHPITYFIVQSAFATKQSFR